MSDWMMKNDGRYTAVVQSLESRRADLRTAADRCRKAYTKDYMNIPMNWLADALDEAAEVLSARLVYISTARFPQDPVESSDG
jgi:hypothetical protein